MAKAKYKANNRIVGLGKKDLELGDTIMLEMEDAEPFVAGGSLSLAEAPAAAEDPPPDPPVK